MTREIRNRGFCITINNPTHEEREMVISIINDQCDIGIAEIEHDGERPHNEEEEENLDWTPHIQGYFHFKEPKRINYLKRRLPRAHIEVAKADWRFNFIYCSKEGKVFAIKGHTLDEAKRKKDKCHLVEIIADAKIMNPQQFEEAHPEEWYKNRERVMRVMIEAAPQKSKPWDGDLHGKNLWIWGKPGIGKSRWANMLMDNEFIYKKNFNKWWDGYKLFETKLVILEDYPAAPAGNALCQHMKIWGDRYQFIGECKGSHTYVEPGRFFFIITSNYPISMCFQNPDDVEAIGRRFEEIEMTEENKVMINTMKLNEDIISQ